MVVLIRGIYAAAAGMLAEELRQEVVANNLANSDTTAFKRAVATAQTGPALQLGRVDDGGTVPVGAWGAGALPGPTAVDLRQGGLRPTGRPLDLALVGKGFFVIETPEGVRYTRDGAFLVDREGYLVTTQGYRVLGEGGPIQVGAGEVSVSPAGQVTVGGEVRGRLRLAELPEGGLARAGDNLFRSLPGVEEKRAGATVQAGHLELPNVQVVREMADLIAIMRAYEANQRLIRAQDETLGQLVSEVIRT